MTLIFGHHLRRNLIAYLALFVALGGTSYAAAKLPKNSVGATQLKKNTVTSPKVKNGSLKAEDFAAGTLLKGDTGPKGDKGDKGDPGAPGANGTNGTNGTNGADGAPGAPRTFRKVVGGLVLNDNTTGSTNVTCNADEIAISAGYGTVEADVTASRIQRNAGNDKRYDFDFRNPSGGGTATIFPEVICAK